MSTNNRFTAWFSATERRALNTLANKQGVTVNYLVRIAVREYLGPEALKKAASDVMDVTRNP